jgi:hypothetical protein
MAGRRSVLLTTTKLLKTCEVPATVVTVIVLGPAAAVEAIVIVMRRLVAEPPCPIAALTPAPLKLTAEAFNRLVPRIKAETELAGAAALGYRAVMLGVD